MWISLMDRRLYPVMLGFVIVYVCFSPVRENDRDLRHIHLVTFLVTYLVPHFCTSKSGASKV
jgi:hypothetical protein